MASHFIMEFVVPLFIISVDFTDPGFMDDFRVPPDTMVGIFSLLFIFPAEIGMVFTIISRAFGTMEGNVIIRLGFYFLFLNIFKNLTEFTLMALSLDPGAMFSTPTLAIILTALFFFYVFFVIGLFKFSVVLKQHAGWIAAICLFLNQVLMLVDYRFAHVDEIVGIFRGVTYALFLILVLRFLLQSKKSEEFDKKIVSHVTIFIAALIGLLMVQTLFPKEFPAVTQGLDIATSLLLVITEFTVAWCLWALLSHASFRTSTHGIREVRWHPGPREKIARGPGEGAR